jgi:hypothetical protein
MGYYYKNVDEKEHYIKLASRPSARKKFSKYRGVTKNNNPKKPYRASLNYQGRRWFIGVFENEIDAAKAWNKLALVIIGDHALINKFDDVK